MINDKRGYKNKPWGYVVCTDTFLSGWGKAEDGRSLYALAVNSPEEAKAVIKNANRRTDMKRPRLVHSFRADGTPEVKMSKQDHMTVVDRTKANAWYASSSHPEFVND